MICPDSDRNFGPEFRAKVNRQNIPMIGSLALTHRCNLQCIHCYAGCNQPGLSPHPSELSREQWFKIIDDCADAGCLTLLMTGGEPLARPDFAELYRRAKWKGILVSVFTNGTMITDPILDLFQELPPRSVEVTLYGATESTFESITNVKGSFQRCIQGIERLIERGVPVKMKTVLMTLNQHELGRMREMARNYGIPFRFDAAIFPRLSGERDPIALRVDPKLAVDQEFANESRARLWTDNLERALKTSRFESLYGCAAGTTSFHVDAAGNLQPCLMIHWTNYNLMGYSFKVAWQHVTREMGEQKQLKESACRPCDKKNLCGYCPAFFRIESGSEHVRAEYLCRIGNYRFAKIKEVQEQHEGKFEAENQPEVHAAV